MLSKQYKTTFQPSYCEQVDLRGGTLLRRKASGFEEEVFVRFHLESTTRMRAFDSFQLHLVEQLRGERTTAGPEDQPQRIEDVQSRQDSASQIDPCDRLPAVSIPGRTKKCSHYIRNCLVKCSECSKYYGCRLCHDEEEQHEMNRFATQKLLCLVCGKPEQEVAEHCQTCGVKFADYLCVICRMFDSTPGKNIYHCGKCGICRIGRGLNVDQFHCDRCDACYPLECKTSHPCRKDALKRNCPICLESLDNTVKDVSLMRCGHAIHAPCFEELTKTDYKCPLCSKSLTDMKAWYNAIDKIISSEVLPEPYRSRKQAVYCFDCEKSSEAAFHFEFRKCGHCKGYNTRL